MGEEYKEIFAILQDDNPLPDGAQVTIDDLEKYNQTVEEIRGVSGVDIIRQRGDYVDKLCFHTLGHKHNRHGSYPASSHHLPRHSFQHHKDNHVHEKARNQHYEGGGQPPTDLYALPS